MTGTHQMTGTPIRVENLWKRFGEFEAVKDVTFTAEAGTSPRSSDRAAPARARCSG